MDAAYIKALVQRRRSEARRHPTDLQAPVTYSPGMHPGGGVNGPQLEEEWQAFGNDITEILQVVARGDLDQCLKFMTWVIVSVTTKVWL